MSDVKAKTIPIAAIGAAQELTRYYPCGYREECPEDDYGNHRVFEAEELWWERRTDQFVCDGCWTRLAEKHAEYPPYEGWQGKYVPVPDEVEASFQAEMARKDEAPTLAEVLAR